MDDNFSWTRLDVLNSCELRHNLEYVKRVKGKNTQDIYITGRVIHNCIQAWAGANYPDDSFIEERVRELISDELARVSQIDKATELQYAKRAVIGSLTAARLYRELELPEHGAIIEERFSIPVPGFGRNSGAPDAYDPITKTIVDLKTQRTGRAKRDQLLHYAWSERLLGREVIRGVFVYPLQTVQLQWYDIDDYDIDDWSERAKAIVSKKGGVVATAGAHCFFCPYFQTRSCEITFLKRSTSFHKADTDGRDD
jgi:CRISPR/Cas system-associated exonuclease Cas4 (RecB family)